MMFRVFRLILCCCCVLTLLLPTRAADGGRPKFFFLVITDIQLGMYEHDQDFRREAQDLEKLVAVANRLHPAFVVNCGDLVNRAGDSREIQEYKRIMTGLNPKIPLYNVPGNHDVKNNPTPASLAAYRAEFGKDYYSFEYEGFQGIVLNTSLIKYPESAPHEAEQQSEWLNATLAKTKDSKQTVIFQHIAWFLNDVDEADNYSNLQKSERKGYLNRFQEAHVRYTFAGHLHDSAFGTDGEIQMRTVGALGKPLGKTPPGFGIVVVNGHDLKFTYYPLSSPPSEVIK